MIPQDLANTIVDPKAYADGKRIDAAFARLRKEMPFAQAHPEKYDPFWVVTKHADILEVERQNDLFHNGDRAATLTPIEVDRKVREMMGGSPHLVRSLVQMDNPDHMAYRKLTQAAFLPQNLKKLEGRIREIARGFIDRMAEKGGTCDFARDVAFLYPLHVIMEVLGVPEVDEPRMLKLTQELFGSADPDLNRSGAEITDPQAGLAAVAETVGEFKIDRSPNKHVAFGYGAHVCPGQHLGRMEMRVLWEELLPRLESVEISGTPKLMEANFVCGPKSVPIRYKMH